MKYLKKFKMITESSIASDLIDYVDDSLIEKYHDEHSFMDEDEIAYLCSDCVWSNFDEDRFVEDFKHDMKNDRNFNDYDDYDFKEYIKSHLTDEKEEKIIELYNDNNYDEDDEDDEKVTEFDEDYLDDLDSDQLKEVIEEDDDEDDFIDWITEYSYGSYSAEEIFSDFYGISRESLENQNRNSYSYNQPKYETFGQYLWKEFQQYIDKQGMQDSWKEGEDFTYKKETTQEAIYNEPELQRNILKNNPSAVSELHELFEEEPGGNNIGDEYEFQKLFIDDYVDNYADLDDEEDVINETADALETLNDNYGLNDKLEKELRKKDPRFFIKIDAEKYNI